MSKNKINERLNQLQQTKGQLDTNKTDFVNKLVNQEEESYDMKAIAEELQKKFSSEEPVSANSGYTKDTLYIEDNLYQAFNALCVNRGDKKKFTNEALRDFVLKKYKQLGK